jgi:predicted metal-dependent hydrolase
MRCSDAAIQKFIAEKSPWVERVLQKNAKVIQGNDEILHYQKIYVSGKKVPLWLGQSGGICAEGVFAKDVKDLKKIYVENLGDAFLKRVEGWSRTIGVHPQSVTFKNYKSRWGCCDANNNVRFHFGLLMLPVDLQDYVIVHELCHIKHHNHSTAFWAEVGKFYSNFKKARSGLGEYSFVTRLY